MQDARFGGAQDAEGSLLHTEIATLHVPYMYTGSRYDTM